MRIEFADTKGVCHLAYDGVKGESYRFSDGIVWNIVDSIATRTTGFKCILIQPSSSKDVTVLSFAGTDSLLDVIVDLDQATGGIPLQYQQALQATLRYRASYGNLFLSGHSLGGGLAAYSSVYTGLPASTINPAPLVGAMSLNHWGKIIKSSITLLKDGKLSVLRQVEIQVRMCMFHQMETFLLDIKWQMLDQVFHCR